MATDPGAKAKAKPARGRPAPEPQSMSEDVQTAAGQAPPPIPTDDQTAVTTATALVEEEDTSAGRVTVPRDMLIRRSVDWLGVPSHVLIGALHEDDREELTLNAAHKAVEKYMAKEQNPAEDEEG